jgi:hypothetical protein
MLHTFKFKGYKMLHVGEIPIVVQVLLITCIYNEIHTYSSADNADFSN